MTDHDLRPYRAIIWRDEPDAIGIRRTLMAFDSTDAATKVKAEFGASCVYSILNEDEAALPR